MKPTKSKPFKDPVYKLIELTGTSTRSIEDAVEKAVKRAQKTLHKMCWVQITDTRGSIEHGKLCRWQVTLKIGFAVEA